MERLRDMKELAEKISDLKYQKGEEIERTSKQYTRTMVPSDKPLKILDVGCGTGLNAKALAAKGHDVVGVDISAEAIKKFREAGFEGQQWDIAKGFPYPENSFDLVYASEIIEHIVDPEVFLAEIYRILRPCGTLVLSTPNSAFWPFRLLALVGRTASEVQHWGHVRFFSRPGLRRLIAEVGFEDIKIAGRHIFLIFCGRVAEMAAPILEKLGFWREWRFRTQSPFWFWGQFSSCASAFWADTLIVTANKSKQ